MKRMDVETHHGLGMHDAYSVVVERPDGELVWHDEAQARIAQLEAEAADLRRNLSAAESMHAASSEARDSAIDERDRAVAEVARMRRLASFYRRAAVIGEAMTKTDAEYLADLDAMDGGS